MAEKQQRFIISQFLLVWDSGAAQLGNSGSHELAGKILTIVAIIWRLNWGWRVCFQEGPFTGYGQEASLHCLMCMLSCFSRVRLFVTLWTIASQDSLTMGFSEQEYWNGLPIPTPGCLPDPRIEPVSPALAGRFFITGATWEALSYVSSQYGSWFPPEWVIHDRIKWKHGVFCDPGSEVRLYRFPTLSSLEMTKLSPHPKGNALGSTEGMSVSLWTYFKTVAVLFKTCWTGWS